MGDAQVRLVPGLTNKRPLPSVCGRCVTEMPSRVYRGDSLSSNSKSPQCGLVFQTLPLLPFNPSPWHFFYYLAGYSWSPLWRPGAGQRPHARGPTQKTRVRRLRFCRSDFATVRKSELAGFGGGAGWCGAAAGTPLPPVPAPFFLRAPGRAPYHARRCVSTLRAPGSKLSSAGGNRQNPLDLCHSLIHR